MRGGDLMVNQTWRKKKIKNWKNKNVEENLDETNWKRPSTVGVTRRRRFFFLIKYWKGHTKRERNFEFKI